MTIAELSPQEYAALLAPAHAFNSLPFVSLNADKCEKVHFLGMFDSAGKVRLGLVAGERDQMLKSPFSAPFGGFDYNRQQGVEVLNDCLTVLIDYASSAGLGISITLPPPFYSPLMQPKITTVLNSRVNAGLITDLNYHIPLDIEPGLSRASRNKLKCAMEQGFELVELDKSDQSLDRAYRVIRANHEATGHPLKMSLGQLQATSRVIVIDTFVVNHKGIDVAAAIIYHTAPGIVQDIYWGDLPESRSLRPMNFLAHALTMHYHTLRFNIFDLGPASEDGIASPGLCDFKEGIGAIPTVKPSISLPFSA